jgi:hypothetical protein
MKLKGALCCGGRTAAMDRSALWHVAADPVLQGAAIADRRPTFNGGRTVAKKKAAKKAAKKGGKKKKKK